MDTAITATTDDIKTSSKEVIDNCSDAIKSNELQEVGKLYKKGREKNFSTLTLRKRSL